MLHEHGETYLEGVFGDSRRFEREERVLEYVAHRIGDGTHLDDILREEYVRRNASPAEGDPQEPTPWRGRPPEAARRLRLRRARSPASPVRARGLTMEDVGATRGVAGVLLGRRESR